MPENNRQTVNESLNLQSVDNQGPSAGAMQVEVQQTKSILTTESESETACRLQLESAREYLGVPPGYGVSHELLSWEQKQKAAGQGRINAPVVEDGEQVMLICVDCEPYTNNSGPVEGVGVSILDTRRIFGVQPGPRASNWAAFIESHYFRTSPESFSDFSFGETFYASDWHLTKRLEQCFGVSYMTKPVNNFKKVVFVTVDAPTIEAKIADLGFYISEVAVDSLDPCEMAMAVFREFEPRDLSELFSIYAIDETSQTNNAGDNSRHILNLLLCIALDGKKEQTMINAKIARSAKEHEISKPTKRKQHMESSSIPVISESPAKRRKRSHGTPSLVGLWSIEQVLALAEQAYEADEADEANSTNWDNLIRNSDDEDLSVTSSKLIQNEGNPLRLRLKMKDIAEEDSPEEEEDSPEEEEDSTSEEEEDSTSKEDPPDSTEEE